MKRILISSIFILLAVGAAFAQDKTATPTAEQLIEKFIQVTGGKAAYEKQTSRVMKGNLEAPAMGVSGPIELYEKAPNKNYSTVDISGVGVFLEGFNGTVAWATNPMEGMREKTGTELADTKRDAEFHRFLKMKEIFPKMTVTGKDKVGDHEVYVVAATTAGGSTEKYYFDTQTGLLLRNDAEKETPQGKISLEFYFEDYRDADGVKMPFTLRQVSPMGTFIIKLSEIKHNVAIDDAKFNKPAGQ